MTRKARTLRCSSVLVSSAKSTMAPTSLRCGPVDDRRFRYGVASADPLPDGVLLWTHSSHAGPVDWMIGLDPELRTEVASGTTSAEAEHDGTVHVDVRGLQPATTYFYRFEAGGERSPVGRTRTAPAPGADRLTIGVVSCAWFARR